jgi:O-antigen ligase
MAVYLVAQVTPRRWIERAAAGVLSVASVVMLLEAFTSGGRVGGLLQGNPNIAAALIVQWSALAHEWVHCAAALLLIQTGSRGAAIAYITAWWGRCAQVLGVLRRWTRFRGARSVLAGSYVVLVLLMVAVRPATIQNRMATWTEAGRLFIARPLVGWGPGSYPVLAQADPGRPHADSLPMTVAAETGVVGLVAWGWLAAWAARAVVRSDDPARWGLVAFAVHNAVDYTLLWYWPGIAVVVALALVRRR